MGSGRKPAKRGRSLRRLTAAALATGLHLLIFLAIGATASWLNVTTPHGDEANAISVTMVRTPSPVRSTVPPSGRKRVKDRQNATAAPPPAIETPGPPPSVAEAPSPGSGPEGLRNTLKGLAGCADPAAYRLSPRERTNCDHRLAPSEPVHFQLDPQEQTAFDADGKRGPLLVRKPHNGCLPRAGDRKSALVNAGRGASMAATTTSGVGCAWSF